jgi:hypothetical protein
MDDVNHISHELKMLRDQLLPVLRQIAGKVSSNNNNNNNRSKLRIQHIF